MFLDSYFIAPRPQFVRLSVLVLEPVAMRSLSGAIAVEGVPAD
jgi:hypothetical protein